MKNLAYRVRDENNLSEEEKVRISEINGTIRGELKTAGISALYLKGPQFEFTEAPYDCYGVLGITDKDLAQTNRMSDHWTSNMWEHFSKPGHFSFAFCRAWYYWIVAGAVPLRVAQEMYDNPLGHKDVRVAGYAGNTEPAGWAKTIGGKQFITSYHIDSQEGLNYFVETVKRHGLVKHHKPEAGFPPDYADWREFQDFVKTIYGDVLDIKAETSHHDGTWAILPAHLELRNLWETWRHARDTA